MTHVCKLQFWNTFYGFDWLWENSHDECCHEMLFLIPSDAGWSISPGLKSSSLLPQFSQAKLGIIVPVRPGRRFISKPSKNNRFNFFVNLRKIIVFEVFFKKKIENNRFQRFFSWKTFTKNRSWRFFKKKLQKTFAQVKNTFAQV